MTTPFQKGQYAYIAFAIDPEQLKQIDEIARQQHSSRATIMRQATAFFLAENNRIAVSDADVTNGARRG